MNGPTIRNIYAKAIGDLVLGHLEAQGYPPAELAERRALAAIAQIRDVLGDDSLDDPACFQRIEKIVALFGEIGVGTFRHDWGRTLLYMGGGLW